MGRDVRLNRRAFISVAGGAAATALVGAWATPATAADQPDRHGHGKPLISPQNLGIQLFTVRDKVASLGFAAVFAELRRIGYKEVEFAGYSQGSVGPITVPEIRRLLDDHGLRGIGGHIGYFSANPNAVTFATNINQVLDDAQTLGLPLIGTASSPARYGNTVDAWKRAAAEFNEYGAAARARGLRFYQHNHADEFAFATDRPDVRLYDVLLAETDPDLVFLEMDVYWAYVAQHRFSTRPDPAGGPPIPTPFEPLHYVLAQPHRYPLFHAKDGVQDPSVPDGYRFADGGDGDIDYQRFISAVENARSGHHRHGRRKIRHDWLVERDDAPNATTNPAGSFSTAQRSFDHFRGLRDKRW